MSSRRKSNIAKFKEVKKERLGRKLKDLTVENAELKTVIKQLQRKQLEEGEEEDASN